jgi:hypothetical protein
MPVNIPSRAVPVRDRLLRRLRGFVLFARAPPVMKALLRIDGQSDPGMRSR